MSQLQPELVKINKEIQNIVGDHACYCRETHFSLSDHVDGYDSFLFFDPTEPSCTVVTCSILRHIVPKHNWLTSLQKQYDYLVHTYNNTSSDLSEFDSESGPIWF